MEKIYISYFHTTDFEESLILASAGMILDSVEWDYEGEIGTFVFENEDFCKKVLDKHKRGNLWLLSENMLSAYRYVKNELFKRRLK